MDDSKESIGDVLCGIIGVIVIIAFILHSCSGTSDEKTEEAVKEQKVEEYEVSVQLDYQEVFTTTNDPINVYVDDEEIAHHQEAGTNKVYTVFLTEGDHELQLKNDAIYRSKTLDFYVDADHTYFSFGTKTRLTFGMEFWEND